MTTTAASPARTAAALPATLGRIVLTGFMGAGKSTVGRLLAAQLGWAFLDLDEHLEARTGLSIAGLFALHGEDHFRRVESAALASALGSAHTVIALGRRYAGAAHQSPAARANPRHVRHLPRRTLPGLI